MGRVGGGAEHEEAVVGVEQEDAGAEAGDWVGASALVKFLRHRGFLHCCGDARQSRLDGL